MQTSRILQLIADEVLARAEPKLGVVPASEIERVEVAYTNGVTLSLPRWLLDRQGHSLMTCFRAAFGPHATEARALLKAYQRVRIIPADLASTLRTLQR